MAPPCPRCSTTMIWSGQWACPACPPPVPPCPRCGYPSVWHAAVQHWGCDRCQLMNPKIQYLVLPSTANGLPPALTAAVKITISIVLIAVAIVIVVALQER